MGSLGPLTDTGPEARALGFYLHVPFCVARCHYCSFNTAPLDRGALRRYLAALAREIDLLGTAPWAPGIRLDSLFFGGGTPSLLAPDELSAVLDRVRAHFAVAPEAEITVECNPESVSAGTLAAYREAGVTRISLGVQSLDDALLERLGRLHSRARRPACLRRRARGGLRRRERRSHVRVARPRRGGLAAHGGGRSRLGARAPLRLRAHPG